MSTLRSPEKASSRAAAEAGLNAGGQRSRLFLMIDKLETGGSERQFVFLATRLNPLRYEIELACMRSTGSFLKDLGRVREFNPGGSFVSRRAPGVYLALRAHLRARCVSIAHAFDFYTNIMLIPLARLAAVPVVIGSQRQVGDLLTPRQFSAQAAVLRLADRVVCNSRAAADRLRAAGVPQRKLVVIPNGLTEAAFAETAPALPPDGVLRVAMIARMNSPAKNHDVFLRAAARLAARLQNVEFLLVGDGPLRAKLEMLAGEVGVAERVRFLGDRRDIAAILASVAASALPSRSESLSNAIIESMAAGVPVVASRAGGNAELIQDGQTGLLVPPGDDESLASALERLLTDPPFRVSCGRRASEFARSKFAPAEVLKSYEQLYDSLMAAKRGCTSIPGGANGVARRCL
jgi:L-malate glycosyltransferase